jgi:hypothetical protein
MNAPMPYEREIFRQKAGFFLMLWRRQGHKTTNMAKLALKKMMKKPGRLVTFASASILVGREMLMKEGSVIQSAFDAWKADAAKANLQVTTNTDGLSADDFLDLFERGRLEAKLWHSKTVCSRTLIIAPNVATARGFSGDVMLDEIGFIPDFKDLWEAMEPIASADPDFSVTMATTPPNDDAHYSYELAIPPENTTFQPDAKGHWYRSQAGVLVHRADVYDTAEAGLKLYDLDTRGVITPTEHRVKALDRDAWDRNYALIFKIGGTAALSLAALHVAMNAGRGKCLFGEDEFPVGWQELLTDDPTSIGYDVATTENKTSNPGSITISQKVQGRVVERVGVVFKTADPDFARAMIDIAVTGVEERLGKPARRLCIDATNERFFATDLKRIFGGRIVVELVISSESIEYRGEKMSVKSYLGSLYVDQYEDANILIADSRYVREDRRLVVKDKGLFVNQTDSRGRHGDTFDSGKLATHGLLSRSGPAEASAVQIGIGLGGKPAGTGNWKNPFVKIYDKLTGGTNV